MTTQPKHLDAWVDAWLDEVRRAPLPRSARLVANTYAAAARDNSDSALALSAAELAYQVRKSPTFVQDGRRELVAAGYLVKVGERGYQTPPLYELTYPAAVELDAWLDEVRRSPVSYAALLVAGAYARAARENSDTAAALSIPGLAALILMHRYKVTTARA